MFPLVEGRKERGKGEERVNRQRLTKTKVWAQKCTRQYKTVHIVAVAIFLLITFMAVLPFGRAIEWSDDTQLTTHPEWDIMPSITQTRDGTIMVVWASARGYPNGYQFDLYFKTSSNYGGNWSEACPLAGGSESHEQWPSVTHTRNGSTWVVWTSDITGNNELFYMFSPDNGTTWSSTRQLTSNSSLDAAPCITQNVDGKIWVVWQSNRTGNHEIFVISSSDYGLSWSDPKNLTTDPSWDMQPSITWTKNGTLWLVWSSYRDDDDYELFYMTSSDYGDSWSGPTQITSNSKDDTRPSVIQDVSGTMWVVFERSNQIYSMTSSDYGESWTEKRIVASAGDDMNPSVVNTDDRKIWVTWESSRTSATDFEIWYMNSSEITSVHDVAVTKITPWVQPGRTTTWAPKGTPIYVNVTVENQGTFGETFNVTTYAESITRDAKIDIGTQNFIFLTNGTSATLTFVWDTAETPSGSYYISANATIVPGEYDTLDNILIDGAYIGGIFPPGKLPEVNLLAEFSPLALTILIVAALGVGAVFFFKLLMSIKPRWPWSFFQGAKRIVLFPMEFCSSESVKAFCIDSFKGLNAALTLTRK